MMLLALVIASVAAQQCRFCNDQTASECQAANDFQTCEGEENACQVTIRSQYKGSTVEHRFTSRWKPLQ